MEGCRQCQSSSEEGISLINSPSGWPCTYPVPKQGRLAVNPLICAAVRLFPRKCGIYGGPIAKIGDIFWEISEETSQKRRTNPLNCVLSKLFNLTAAFVDSKTRDEIVGPRETPAFPKNNI